jgi:hypothetical protein
VPPIDIAQLVTAEPPVATHFTSLLTVLSDRVTLTPVNVMPPPKRRPRTQKSSAALTAAPSSVESDTQSTSSGADRPASDQLPRRRAGSKSSKGSLEDVFSEGDDSTRRTLLQRQSRRAANLREFVQTPSPSEEHKPESVARKSEDNATEKKKEKRKSARKNKQVTAKATDLAKTATDRKGNLTARDKRDKKDKRLSGKKQTKTSFETRQSDLERERLEAIKNMGQVDVTVTAGAVPILSIATNVLNKRASDERVKSPRKEKKGKTPRDKNPKEDKPGTPHDQPAAVQQDTNKSREVTPRQLSPRTEVKVEPVKSEISPRTPRTEDVKVEPVTIPPPDTTQSVKTDTSPRTSREPTPRETASREPSPRTPRTDEPKVDLATEVSPLRPPSRPISVENSEDEADEPIGDLPVDDEDSSEEELVRVVERQNSLVMRELDDEARALVNPSVAEIEAAMKSNVSDIQDKLDEILLAQEGEKDAHQDHPEDTVEDHADHAEDHDDSASEEEHHEHGADTPHSHSHEHSDDEDDSPDEHKKHEEHSSEHEEDDNEEDEESPREYDEDHEDDVLVL